MSRRTWLRAGLAFFAIVEAVVGLWALCLPRSFYDDFPLPGLDWVSALPAYNEHLLRDVGELNLMAAVVLGAAAVILERRLVRVALAAYLAYTAPHMLFHAFHLGPFATANAAVQLAGVAMSVLVPLVLLDLTRHPESCR